MFDVGAVLRALGAVYRPPRSIKWMYRVDFNDRKIDIEDVSGVAKNFGKISAPWTLL